MTVMDTVKTSVSKQVFFRPRKLQELQIKKAEKIGWGQGEEEIHCSPQYEKPELFNYGCLQHVLTLLKKKKKEQTPIYPISSPINRTLSKALTCQSTLPGGIPFPHAYQQSKDYPEFSLNH